MLANILVKPGKIELSEVTTPKPSRGEILVKIEAALTCGTDLKAFLRGHPLMPMPGVFGHEFSGIVARVGRGVSRFKEGNAVMAVHTAPCRKCAFCRKRLYNLCERIMKTKVLGAFAEYILLPSHVIKQNVFHKPKNLPFEEAAFLEPLSCVVHSVESMRIKKGESALIFGAGPIGLLHLLLLKMKSAKVTVADIKKERLQIAENLGADLVVVSDTSDSRVKNITGGIVEQGRGGGIGFDYVFECAGMPDVWEDAVNYARRGGTVVLFGGCKSGTTATYDTGKIHYDEITLRGVFHYTPADVKKAYELLCSGKLCVSRLISGRYPLTHTQRVFEKLSNGVGLKYAIVP